MTYTPTTDLDTTTSYTITILASATDLAGNPLDGDGDGNEDSPPSKDTYSWDFTTGDSTPLTILLVDDDDGLTNEGNFQTALTTAGYTFDNWQVSSQGSPDAVTLQDYTIVIWFTSDDYTASLTTTDQANLASYLDNDGRLFITGQDIGYDVGASSFYSDYLHANYVTDDTGDTSVNGVAGDPIGDGLTGIAITGTYPSEITAGDAAATTIFEYPAGETAGIKADAGAYRVVYFAFNYFEGSDGNQDVVMDRVITWLTAPPDTTPPTFGGLESVTDTNFAATLELSWSAATDENPVSYNIYMSTSSGGQNFGTPDYTTSGTTLKANGLTNGQTYYFVVRAEDIRGNEETNTVEESGTPTGSITKQKWAVIAGVSDYKAISDLSYCDEDATDWYNYLINPDNFVDGIAYTNIWVYGDGHPADFPQYDGIATEANMKAALANMVDNAGPDDTLAFITSGHGDGDGVLVAELVESMLKFELETEDIYVFKP